MPNRKYEIKEHLLEEWSPELAYFLGVVLSDGQVKSNGVKIDLKAEDVEVLNYIRDWISPDRPVNGPYYIKDNDDENNKLGKNPYYRLDLCSVSLAKKIIEKFKILPCKTGSESIDFDIPDEFWPDFLRGFFDGDGFVTYRNKHNKKRNKTYPNYEAGFVSSSEKLLMQIKDRYGGNKGRKIRLKTETKRRLKNGELPKPMFAWEFGRKEAIKLRSILYEREECFAMERKRAKFEKF